MVLKIHITLFLALLYNLYISKKKIFFISYLFIIMHELSHMIVALLLKIDIEEIILLPFGATAKYKGNPKIYKELLIALTGPLASVLFAFFYHNNTYYIINILIAIFNLIPIYPLDGGRILRALFYLLFGEKNGNKYSNLCSRIFMLLLILFSVYVFIQYKNISFLLITMCILKIEREEIQKEKIKTNLQSLIKYVS